MVEAYSALFVSTGFCALFPEACATHAGHNDAQPNATNSVPTLRTLLSIKASHLQFKIRLPYPWISMVRRKSPEARPHLLLAAQDPKELVKGK
jgi:hypothetical protein